jgi:NADPH2:quinone reductase
MRAVQVVALDGPAAVQVGDVPGPAPGEDQVLVEVHAAGVTFPEVLQTRGLYQYKPDLPFVPGAEVAGVVRSAPAGSGFAPGDRVAAFPGVGGYAELVTAAPSLVFPIPDRLSFASAAGVPMNYLTTHFGLVRRGRLQAGETVLVHGAAGGVGTAAVQLAKALGARVVAVVSTDAKGEVARAAGADDVVLADGFLAAVKELTGGRGVDLVVDPVGGDRFTDSLRSLAPEGRLLVIGFTGGEIPNVKVNRLLLNNIAVVGVGWGAFALPRPGFAAEQWTDLRPHLESGAIDPPLAEAYPLAEAAKALTAMEERQAAGKLVLTVR